MASKSRSGLNEEAREKFLRDHGFEQERSGKGSHELWEHAELKMLARTNKISMPANLASNIAQKAWQTTLCADPAGGTWRAMVKHAEWCQSTVEQIKAKSEHDRKRCEVAAQFRKAAKDNRRWRKSVKLHLKQGLPADEAPKPPIDHAAFDFLKTMKNQLSKP